MVCAAEHVLVRDTSETEQMASVNINREEQKQQVAELTSVPFACSLVSDTFF